MWGVARAACCAEFLSESRDVFARAALLRRLRGSRASLWPAESPLGRHSSASVTIELSILNKFEQAKMAAPRHCRRRAGPGARSVGDDVQVLGRVLAQVEATVESVLQRRERQAVPHRPLRHAGGRGPRVQCGDPRASSRRPSSAQDEPRRRRPISPEAAAQAVAAQAPPRRRSRRRRVDAPLPAGVNQDPRTKTHPSPR